MNRLFVSLVMLAALCMIVSVAGSCDKLKNVKGNVAGRVQTESGRGVGYISVALVDVETGQEKDRMTSEDSGSFLFREVTPGKYTIKAYTVQGGEIPSDGKEIKLGPGRTANVEVVVNME